MCVQYIGGCSAHRGMFSTSGVFSKYIEGIPWVHRRGYHEYIGGCSVPCGGIMSTSGGVQYIEGIPWVHQGDIMSTSGCSVHWGFQYKLKGFCHRTPPHASWYPPLYSWYPPDVLMVSPDVPMVSPRWTEHLPMYWIFPDLLIQSENQSNEFLIGRYFSQKVSL